MQIDLEYEIGQEVYTIIKKGDILQTQKVIISRIIIWNKNEITYEISKTGGFLNNVYSTCYRENGKVLKFKTENEAKKYIENLGGK